MNRTLKQRLQAGDLTIGSWLTLGHTAIAEIMAAAGFDWLVLDMEHSVLTLDEVQQMLQTLDAHHCPGIVRLTSNDANQIKRVADAGATGIMVPQVNSAAQAQAAVDALYYPPRGRRGVGLARAQAYGAGFAAYREWLQDNAVVVVMIEHIDAVAVIDEILAVSGVDAFIVGPYDLSGSLGCPGVFDDPRFSAALEQIRQAGVRADKPGGIHVVEPDLQQLREAIDSGFRFLGYALDIRILDSICRAHLAEIRTFSLPPAAADD